MFLSIKILNEKKRKNNNKSLLIKLKNSIHLSII